MEATPSGAELTHEVTDLERETIARVTRRLLPMLIACYFVAYLDRVNVGFASLTMNKALGFSSAVYGFGGGIFFLGYFIFEVPSNLLLSKVGARRWIARILVTWGIISGCMALRHRAVVVLHAALPAGHRRGGLLSRYRALPNLVVPSILLPVPHPRRVHGGDHRCPVSWARWCPASCSISTAGWASPAGSGCSFWRPRRRCYSAWHSGIP